MSINLTWKNLTTGMDSIEVYRSDTTIDPNNPGAPLATLPAGTTQYTDETAEFGTEYFYAIGTTKSGNTVLSKIKDLEAMRIRGPGGQKILRGDSRLGYMGPLSFGDIPNVFTAMKLDPGVLAALGLITWHKFIRKNKILIIPEKSFSITANIQAKPSVVTPDIGADSGIDWGSIDTSKWINTGKGTTVEGEGFKYYLRAPRGFRDDWDGVSLETEQALDPETEFNEIVQCMLCSWVIPNKIGSINGYDSTATFPRIICAEQKPDGTGYLTRLSTNTGPGPAVGSFTNDTAYRVTNFVKLSDMSSWSSSSGSTYFPVLELIEE